jgi:hypothetical protein
VIQVCAEFGRVANLWDAEHSPFYLPIRSNDPATLGNLIREPDPKAHDARGNSPLMWDERPRTWAGRKCQGIACNNWGQSDNFASDAYARPHGD